MHPDRHLEAELRRLETSNLSQRNQKLLKRWAAELAAADLSTLKIERYLQSWRMMAPSISWALDEAGPDDVVDLVAAVNQDQVNEKTYAAWSKAELRKAVRKFYVDQGQEELVDWVSCTPKKQDRPEVDPATLPTRETIQKMVASSLNARDRAMIYCYWMTGARNTELRRLTWRNVSHGGRVTRLTLPDSKTGQRTVPAREIQDVLEELRELHGDPGLDDYVFPRGQHAGNTFRLDPDSCLSRKAVGEVFNRVRDRTDILDRIEVTPQRVRQGRAVDLARKGMTAYQLMGLFGWEKVETALYYVRLAEKDVERAVLEVDQDTKDIPLEQTTLAQALTGP